VCDVDGTLTDGAMWYGPAGEALKRFDTRDGHGIGRLHAAGIAVAFVTAEDSAIARARAQKLGVRHVVLGCADKGHALRALRAELGLAPHEVAMIGDDLGDLPAFAESGVRVAVADGISAVRDAADVVCARAGGHGAVRELADALLASAEDVTQVAPRDDPRDGSNADREGARDADGDQAHVVQR
jgi:YrbI family 3-deoxy-D-manno-octulosonate 8-phosphate phosphatase